MMAYGYIHGGGFFMLLIYAVLVVVPFYKLWQRTGHNGWIALLMIIPLVNVVMLYVLAFKEWPATDRTGGGAS
ncbi:MAG: hypothetical protein WCD16_03785 [Paracoccaceae bacterium]